jgi:mannose-1-phosphate guanylyltransferase/phosphomannomutase
MAGGEGSRLRPLTSRTPKPLAPVANKPVMEHIVELLRLHGITEIVATVHYLADEIESYFGDGSAFGVTMHYVVEDTPLGTAGAVKMAERYLNDDSFIIVSGDALTDIDLTAVMNDHRTRNADATIVLQRVTNPLEFGVVVTDDNSRITRFLEKPSWGEIFSDTINTGIYVLNPSIFGYMEAGRIYDFSKDLFPLMVHQGKTVQGFVSTDYWTDIGNLQQYQQANFDALNGKVRCTIPGDQIRPGVWVGENTHIHHEANVIAPVAIGRNVSIGAGATVGGDSVLGNSTIVARNANFHRSVSWDNAYFGEQSTVTGSTIANRNIIKDRVTIGDGCVVGSGCTIGSGAVVRPNLKLWPDKSVSSGAIVSMSLIYGIKWPGSLFGAIGVSGLANVEITAEFAMKLGQAFGSYLKPGTTVLTSRDAHPASRIMNRAIISGLLSVGVNVEDLQNYPLPLTRFATHGTAGGVHARISPDDPNDLLIEVLDKDGINVDKTVERKIENLFFREDFRRTSMDEVGNLSFRSRSLEEYAGAFLGALKPTALQDAGFKVVLDYAYGNAANVMPSVLSNVRVETIALNAYYDERRARTFRADRDRYIEQLANVSQTLHANLGILFDHDGETFAVVDDKGRVVECDRLSALFTLMVARTTKGAVIAMPATVTEAIDRIASENGATIERTRSDRRSMMAYAEENHGRLAFAAGTAGEPIFPEFSSAFDALYGAVKLMEMLAAEKCNLSELVDMLPDWHVATREIACPWERKGIIMRTILDENKHNSDIDLADGIRIRRDGGWALVLPDASDPKMNVYAEGRDDGQAQNFADALASRIAQLVGT